MTVDQIIITPLKRIKVVGGDVLHCLKYNDPGFIDFGEAYFSLVDYKSIKAWKRHIKMTLNLVVPVGTVHFVFIDSSGKIREESIGDYNYARLTIPPNIWFGFKGINKPSSLIINIADIPHEPIEVERSSIDEFNFDWEGVK
jgi:dTDP-4-dehydrorhamnose 3,5-epimerase